MITEVTIKPEKNTGMAVEYKFSEVKKGGKNWFNVTAMQGGKSYVLGSVISGEGFISCEGTVIRPQLMECLNQFHELKIKITATDWLSIN